MTGRIRGKWPALSGATLHPTLTTLHLWTQVVGKIRLKRTPWTNHSWHVPLYVSARGLTSGLVHHDSAGFELEFDLVSGQLALKDTLGGRGEVPLKSQSVAAFYDAVMELLRAHDLPVEIAGMPCEIKDATAFREDHAQRSFDLEAARAYWLALVQIHRVMQVFRSRFVGKCSPIHLFWGSFDLAVTRFSGRAAPRHPGGMVHTPDAVAREAYSQEVSSAGFWPGDGVDLGPTFYSYAYPSPPGFGERSVQPAAAFFSPSTGEFLLSYAEVASASDPDAALLAFLQSTYEATADLAHWDRDRLEGPSGPLGVPPEKFSG